jgi:hypothetical protein
MTFKQPFCVGGDIHLINDRESKEKDLNGRDPFCLIDRVAAAPSEYIEAQSPDVHLGRFDRTHLKHVYYVYNVDVGIETTMSIFAELKDGRLVALFELMEDMPPAVHIWSSADREPYYEALKGRMLTGIACGEARLCDALFDRVKSGRTVRQVYYS